MTITRNWPTLTVPSQRSAQPPRLVPGRRPPAFPRRPRSMQHRKLVMLILFGFDIAAGAPLLMALPQLRPTLAGVFGVALLSLRHAGLFRPRFTLSVLDDLPLLGRAFFTALPMGISSQPPFHSYIL